MLKITSQFRQQQQHEQKKKQISRVQYSVCSLLAESHKFSQKWFYGIFFKQNGWNCYFSRMNYGRSVDRSVCQNTRVYFGFRRFFFPSKLKTFAAASFPSNKYSHEIFRKIFELIKSGRVSDDVIWQTHENDNVRMSYEKTRANQISNYRIHDFPLEEKKTGSKIIASQPTTEKWEIKNRNTFIQISTCCWKSKRANIFMSHISVKSKAKILQAVVACRISSFTSTHTCQLLLLLLSWGVLFFASKTSSR